MNRPFSRIRRYSAICIAIAFLASFFLKASLGGLNKEGVIEPEAVVESKGAAVVSWRSADKNNAWVEDRRRMLSSIYNPNTPLVSQLRKLRSLSDSSNPYATCVLAWALDLCSRGPELIPIGEYSDADLRTLDEENVTRIAKSLESQDRYEMICSGLVTDDLKDMDDRLLQAARMGHVRSMTKLAQLPPRSGSGLESSTQSFSLAHQKNAEVLLNRAAEAGDPDAIRGIYNAYSGGYISSEMGDVKVAIDMPKSLAALRIISLNTDPQQKDEIEQGIAEALNGMDKAQHSRFDRYESVYRRAYAKIQTATTELHSSLSDSPEQVCAQGFSAPGALPVAHVITKSVLRSSSYTAPTALRYPATCRRRSAGSAGQAGCPT